MDDGRTDEDGLQRKMVTGAWVYFKISEDIWSISNILYVKNHHLNTSFAHLAPLGIYVFDLDYTGENS